MNIVTCAIPCDSTGLVEHMLSYLCRLNADSLSFTDHQKADVCMGVVRRLLGLSGYVMGASDTNGAIIPPVHDHALPIKPQPQWRNSSISQYKANDPQWLHFSLQSENILSPPAPYLQLLKCLYLSSILLRLTRYLFFSTHQRASPPLFVVHHSPVTLITIARSYLHSSRRHNCVQTARSFLRTPPLSPPHLRIATQHKQEGSARCPWFLLVLMLSLDD